MFGYGLEVAVGLIIKLCTRYTIKHFPQLFDALLPVPYTGGDKAARGLYNGHYTSSRF